MQLNISGHHLDITPALKQHTNQKLSKIKHHFDQVMNINMILEVQKDVQTAEATIHVRGADLFAKAESNDMFKYFEIEMLSTAKLLRKNVVRRLDLLTVISMAVLLH